jgi:aspartyl-tRNA(Asn)/glutamyl-tRNA(Gln) amidotransferase subunit A
VSAAQYLRRIRERNPSLGAFVEIASSVGSGPIALAVKDNIDVAGFHAAAGMQVYRNRIPKRDATCVAALRARGAVVLGKTLMDEAAFGALGDNPWFGRCHNPLRHGYTCGGSSAGSACAVAAGLCDAALGTDTLGSVRIPASYCGVVGFVPTHGVFSLDGVMPLAPSFDRVGLLTRSIELAGQLAAIRPAGNARIAHVDLNALDWTALRRAALLMVEREGARVHAALLADPRSAISPGLRKALEFGAKADPERLSKARAVLDHCRQTVETWLGEADVLVLPATPQTAFPFHSPVPENQADYTVPASVLGLPAISVPLGSGPGVQLVGRRGADALLLAAATQVL